MNDLLKLHQAQGNSSDKNELHYIETLDEHFNLGELSNVVGEDNKLKSEIPTSVFLKGSDFVDSSTFNRIVTKGNVDIVDDATFGKVYSFNGSNSYLNVLEDLPIENDFTIDFWVNLPSTQPVTCSRIFITATGYTTATGLNLELPSSTSLRFFFTASSVSYTDIDISDCIDKWSHMAFTRKGDKFKLFINGKLRQEKTFSTQLNQKKLWIGNINTNEGWFKGKICNFRVMNYAVWTEEFTPSVPSMYQCEGYRISPPIELPSNIKSAKLNWEGEGKISICETNIKEKPLFPKDTYTDWDLTTFTKNNSTGVTKHTSKEFNVRISNSHTKGLMTKEIPCGAGAVCFDYRYAHGGGSYSTSNSHLILGMRDSKIVESANYNDNDYNNAWELYYDAFNQKIMFKVSINEVKSVLWTSEAIMQFNVDMRWTEDFLMLVIKKSNGDIIHNETYEFSFDTTPTFLMKGYAMYDGYLYMTILDEVVVSKGGEVEYEWVEVKKNEKLKLGSKYLMLKEEIKSNEYISNVRLDAKYNRINETIKPMDLIDVGKIPSILYVYKNGDECVKTTGGWKGHQWDSSFPNGYYSKKDTYLEYGDNSSNYGDGGFVINNGIDLTPYSKLKVKYEMVSWYAPGYDASTRICICQDNVPTWRNKKFDLVSEIKNAVTVKEETIDITNYNGVFYLGVEGGSGAYNHHTHIGRLHYMYLEK